MATVTAPVEQRDRPLTIGAVCRRLKEEFPDVSISKIRYLEDQGLLAPRRTRGGYRLFAEEDVERLETILRLQRDEFLPLRVIKQELAAGPSHRREARPGRSGLRVPEDEIDLEELCARSGADAGFVRELENYGLLEPRVENGARLYLARDVEVAGACLRLAQYGLGPRNLTTFRRGADNEAGLLERLVAHGLRSANPEKRHEAIEDLEMLAALSQELQHLLFWRALRSLVPR